MANFAPQLYQCDVCGACAYTLDGLLSHACQDPVASALNHADLHSRTASTSTSHDLDKWEECDVRLLITSYADNKHFFESKNGKTKKKEVFLKIANSFNLKSEKKVTADQCQRKWQKLVTKYKEVEDHNSQTGRDKKKWKFLEEMDACLAGSPQIKPAFTIDTSVGSSCSSPTPDDENDEVTEGTDSGAEESGGKKVKLPTRKRKSHSSAAEMLTFLQSYSERREKVETEKLELLKTMNEEKKRFLFSVSGYFEK